MNTQARHTEATLGRVVRRAVITAAVGVAITSAAFGTVTMLTNEFQIEMTYGGAPDSDSEPGALSAAEALVERYDCWTTPSSAPPDMQGQRPGHVVVTTATDPTTATYSADLVGEALDEVGSAGHSDLLLHAYCR